MRLHEIIANYHPKPLGTQSEFAVFLPLMTVDGCDHLLYQVRGQSVSQAGETSFPGGFIEPGESIEEAACREFEEEMGISRERLEVYGQIDYMVSDHAIIYAVVGQVHGVSVNDFRFNEEVDRVFTLPLQYLKDHPPVEHDLAYVPQEDPHFPYHLLNEGKDYRFSNRKYPLYFYDLSNYNQEILWGFTAHLTHRFIKIIHL